MRFAFGGVVTMVAGIIADSYGPAIGGVMLAFPAILPASLTLVKQHDGQTKATDDARGARLGSLALATFGLPVWLAASSWSPPAVLGIGTLMWIMIAVSLWRLEYGGSASG